MFSDGSIRRRQILGDTNYEDFVKVYWEQWNGARADPSDMRRESVLQVQKVSTSFSGFNVPSLKIACVQEKDRSKRGRNLERGRREKQTYRDRRKQERDKHGERQKQERQKHGERQKQERQEQERD
ncbi:hypothetical protein NDU88_003057 [Pleurodeles waltl]|uniref:Uncharacterized protein n=1 Tax=Pleurodeles waltl TaxID=8319 RepID=A0AAV7VCB7_PLEWA|nr:hypothetical protein NDU88_003057 [Pleurodeles waltl]